MVKMPCHENEISDHKQEKQEEQGTAEEASLRGGSPRTRKSYPFLNLNWNILFFLSVPVEEKMLGLAI